MRVKYALSLIRAFTIADLKIKYKGSVLGYFWSLLNPLLMLITIYIVFSMITKFEIPHYQLYILLGIIVWNFFSEATIGSMNSLIEKADFMKKFDFPRESIIVSSCLVAFITLILNLLVFFLFMLILKVPFTFTLLLLPFYLAQIFILILGLSLLLSALNARFRDITHIWSFILLLGFFITPIVYPLSIIPFEYLRFYMLNPLARMIVDIRDITIYNYIPDPKNFLITLTVSILIFAFGWYVFYKKKNHFVEQL